MTSSRRSQHRFRCLTLCLTVASSLYTASQTADLSGTVRDSSGAVIPKATVTITKENTGFKQETLSEEKGFYRFAFLLPGSYALTATAQGFDLLSQPSVKLDADQTARVDFTLLPAAVQESVTVRGNASSVQTLSPVVATEVDSELIRDLPVNGRSFQALIALAPGASYKPSDGTSLNVNGQRDTANYFTVDGVSANVAMANNPFGDGPTPGGVLPVFDALGSTHAIISMEALQEFKLQASTYTAEIGRAGGGQLAIVSRSGSNEFHGSVFDYFRNEILDANDWFANAAGFPRAELRQNDFGGFFGGPILKDRTFFFFSYEGLRAQLPTTLKTSVPSLAAREAATGPIQQLLNAFPLPNGPEDPESMLAIRTNTYFSSPSLDNTSFRMDHAVNDRLTVFGRYSEAPSGQKGSGGAGSEIGSGPLNFRSATVGATLVVSPHTASDLRLNYSRTQASASDALASLGRAIPPPDSLLFPAFASPGSSRIFVSIGDPHFAVGRLADNLQRQGNIVSNTSLVRGSHEVKFGADYRYLAPHYGPFNYRQAIFFGDVPTALSGVADEVDIDSIDSVTLGIDNLSLYGEDTWKIKPRLTLTYGLRWELVPPPHATGGQQLFTLTGLPSSGFPHFRQIQLAPPGTPLYKTSYTNLAPRVGAAYQLFRAPGRETVVRGGFGIYYDLGVANATDAAASFPHRLTKMAFFVPYPLSPEVTAPPPSANFQNPSGTFNVFGPDHVLPRSYQWNITIDQRFGPNQVLSTSYVGELGRRLLRSTFLQDFGNLHLGPSQIFLTTNASSSDYHALQVQFRRRMSRGLATLLSYTWSHSIDDTSTDVGFDNLTDPCLDPPCNDRGPSDFDVRHAFKAAFTYDIPAPLRNPALHAILNNWSIASIYAIRTALPVNVTVGRGDVDGDPSLFVTRPDLVPDAPLYIHNSILPGGKGINPAAFSVPIEVHQGDLGRNALRGFGFMQLDFAIQRQFGISDNVKLEWRGDFFNVFNSPHFYVDGNLGSFPPFQPNPTFGAATLTVGGPRQIQLALRLHF
jgi:Carboxypeptidase regulatory-like domain/TonB dependent receptor